jgi:hypothetical protein
VLGVAYLAIRGVTEIIALLRRPRRFGDDPFDGVYEDVTVRMVSAAGPGLPESEDLPPRSALAEPALIGRSEF